MSKTLERNKHQCVALPKSSTAFVQSSVSTVCELRYLWKIFRSLQLSSFYLVAISDWQLVTQVGRIISIDISYFTFPTVQDCQPTGSFLVVSACHQPKLDGFVQHFQATVHFLLAAPLINLSNINICFLWNNLVILGMEPWAAISWSKYASLAAPPAGSLSGGFSHRTTFFNVAWIIF